MVFLGEKFVELPRYPVRVDRLGIGEEQRHEPLGLHLFDAAQVRQPIASTGGAVVGEARGRVEHGAQDRAGVSHQAERDVPVPGHGLVVHVDVHDRGVVSQSPPVAHTEIEWRANDDDHVGLLEGIAPGAVEVVGIARRQQPAGRAVHVARNIEALEQRDGFPVAAAHPDLGPEQDGGSLRFHQELCQRLDVGRVADGPGGRPIAPWLRDDRFVHCDLGVENVAGDFQIAGARGACEAFPCRHGNHVGDTLGGAHACGKLGDRRGNVHVGQILQRAHLVLGQGALPANVQHRAFGTKRGRDTGKRIRKPGAGRGNHAAQPAGLARVAVGGVGRDLLVAHVDDADIVVDATIVGVDDVAAAEREDRVDAFVPEGRTYQVPA